MTREGFIDRAVQEFIMIFDELEITRVPGVINLALTFLMIS